ncbi:MAG: PQQ-dependent sugar dehydrogenase [Thiobacillus sp.]
MTRINMTGLFLGMAVLAGASLYFYRGYLAPLLPAPASASGIVDTLSLPAGFRIHLYADNLPGARSMALSPAGTLFVGTRDAGKVYAVEDRDGDHRADRVHTLASGLRMPNGVAFRGGDLYVAEVSRVLRFPAIESSLGHPPQPQVVSADYPEDGHHGWKFIAFGPDGWLYVPVGAPCNVCDPDDPVYAGITRLDIRTGAREIYARGVRNTVGFDWHPDTGALWFTDNGRDWLGENRPPDELNRAPEAGLHFGFPYCHGAALKDPEFGTGRDCSIMVPPALELGPHVAALGMRFYRGTQFPARYRGGIFIAEHGSWNRTVPIGYRVMFVPVHGNRPAVAEVFAEGWLRDGRVSGPVDVQELPDGSLLISDDKGGRIYRVAYAGESGRRQSTSTQMASGSSRRRTTLSQTNSW